MDERIFNLIVDKECSICYDKVCKKDRFITKPCLHLFHIECMDNYSKFNKQKCPYCNTIIKREFLSEKDFRIEKNKINFLGFVNVLGDIFTNTTGIDTTEFINDIEKKSNSNSFDETLNEIYLKYKKN